jgi:hypothetical protein
MESGRYLSLHNSALVGENKVKLRILAAGLPLSFLCLFAWAAVDSAHPIPRSPLQTSAASRHLVSTDPGEQIFQSNCARCHTPPMALPQRITGTVLMHMRVRGRLSRQDEKLLLHYMAP